MSLVLFFFSSRRRHTRYWRDWSSDVCSSDLALYRLRPADFGEIKHADGVSPAWPLSYNDFEPWYTKAEWLYQVRGVHGEDPTEGHWSKQYPWPPVSHEPRVQQISDALSDGGYHPFHAPCGILLDEADRPVSSCLAFGWCDG